MCAAIGIVQRDGRTNIFFYAITELKMKKVEYIKASFSLSLEIMQKKKKKNENYFVCENSFSIIQIFPSIGFRCNFGDVNCTRLIKIRCNLRAAD